MIKSYSVDSSGIMGIIKTYLEDFTDLYTLKDEVNDSTIYHVNKYDIDLVFTTVSYSGKKLVCVFLVKEFPETANTKYGIKWCGEADNIIKWVGNPVQHDIIPGVGYSVALPVYYPCAFLDETDVKTIYFDYNSKNNTIMISVERSYEYHIVGVDNPSYKYGSESIIISDSEKYLDFEGGFFIGGNCGCAELVCHNDYRPNENPVTMNFRITDYLIADSHANCVKFHVTPPPRCFSGLWTYPWSDDPYRNNHCRLMNGDNIPNIKNYHAFDIIMYGKIDNAPHRNRGEVAVDLSQEAIEKTQPSFMYFYTAGRPYYIISPMANNSNTKINLLRYADWCTSCQPYPLPDDSWTDGSEGRLGYFYPIAVPSITNSDIKVPRYEPLLSNNFLENGHNVNTLNNITTVMPLYIMVRRDPPEEVLSYSAVCRNDVINMVNMRYMCPSNTKNGIYPIKEKTYSCYNIGTRRNLSGFMGYQGLAFEQEEPVEPVGGETIIDDGDDKF